MFMHLQKITMRGFFQRCLASPLALVLISCAAVAASTGAEPETPSNLPTFTPDPLVQADLHALVSASGEKERRAIWDRLRATAAADHAGLIRQLVYFAQGAQGTQEAMLGGAVIQGLDLPDDTVVRALVPLLETDDRPLKAQVGNILGGYEDRAADRPPNFSAYREVVGEAVRADSPLPRTIRALRHPRAAQGSPRRTACRSPRLPRGQERG